MPNVQKKQSALPFYRRSKLLGYSGARGNFTFTPDTNDFINVFLPDYLHFFFFGRPFAFLSSFYCKPVKETNHARKNKRNQKRRD